MTKTLIRAASDKGILRRIDEEKKKGNKNQ
jgi:hypothetical protein